MFHQDQDAVKEPVQRRAGERTFEAEGQTPANAQGNNGRCTCLGDWVDHKATEVGTDSCIKEVGGPNLILKSPLQAK